MQTTHDLLREFPDVPGATQIVKAMDTADVARLSTLLRSEVGASLLRAGKIGRDNIGKKLDTNPNLEDTNHIVSDLGVRKGIALLVSVVSHCQKVVESGDRK